MSKISMYLKNKYSVILLFSYLYALLIGVNMEHMGFFLLFRMLIFGSIAGCLFLSGFWKKNREIKFLLILPVMFIVFEFIKGLIVDNISIFGFRRAVNLFCTVILFFGFSTLFESTEERKQVLNRFLKWATSITCVCMFFMLLGVVMKRSITFFNGTFVFGVNYSASGRLSITMLGWYQYYIGFLATFFFFINIYLLLESAFKAKYLVFAVTEPIFLAVVLLSGGRTVLIGLFIGLFLFIYAVTRRYKISKGKANCILIFAIIAGCAVMIAVTNFLYSNVLHSIRDIWYGLATLTSRTTIWRGCFLAVEEHPWAAAFGLPYGQMMEIMNEFIRLQDYTVNMHSGFVQFICLLGIPGLIFLVICSAYWGSCSFQILMEQDEEVALSDKLLVIASIVLYVQNFLECVLFSVGSREPLNNLFFLLAGYTIWRASNIKKSKMAWTLSGLLCAIPIVLLVYSYWGPPETENVEIHEAVKIHDVSTDELDNGSMRLIPGVTKEMQDVSFWQDQVHGDEVILTEQEIHVLNEKNARQLVSDQGLSIDLITISETLEGDFVENLVNTYSIPADFDTYYINDTATTAEYWNILENNRNVDAISDRISVMYGYSTVWTTIRQLPDRNYVYKKEQPLEDYLDNSDYRPFEPVVVVHESADGQWYYVLMKDSAGWIEKEAVAFCHSKEEWLERQQSEFLLVTGREIQLEDDPMNPSVSGICMPMGTKLSLVKESEIPETVGGRSTYGNYVVKIPVRDIDGYIKDSYCLIPVSFDVQEGYLPYTTNQLLNQAFKCLGARYGWAGAHHGFDCSSYTQAIYACFGIELFRGSRTQIFMEGTDHGTFDGMDHEKRLQIIKEMPIGTLLYFNGHIMMYLGMVEEDPYVISAVGSVCFRNEGEFEVTDPIPINSVVINNLNETFRGSNYSWIDSLSSYNIIEK